MIVSGNMQIYAYKMDMLRQNVVRVMGRGGVGECEGVCEGKRVYVNGRSLVNREVKCQSTVYLMSKPRNACRLSGKYVRPLIMLLNCRIFLKISSLLAGSG